MESSLKLPHSIFFSFFLQIFYKFLGPGLCFFFKLCYLDVSKKFELIELYFFYKFLKITGFRYSGLLKKLDFLKLLFRPFRKFQVELYLTWGLGQPTRGLRRPTRGLGRLTGGLGWLTRSLGQLTQGLRRLTHGLGRPTRGLRWLTQGLWWPTWGLGWSTPGLRQPSQGFRRPTNGLGWLTWGLCG